MIDTTRIQSGFDAELMIGKRWFLTAINTLEANGVLNLPNGISIVDINVIDDPDWDLELITNLGIRVKAKMSINNNKFSFLTDFNDTSFEINMPNLGRLADTPSLKKVIGDNEYENAMALLFNLDIRASAQDLEPLPSGQHVLRGNPDDAQSFLPTGQHIALGIPREAFFRFGNNIWHTQLRDVDGSHPLPQPGDTKKGDWKRVKVSVTQERIRFTLEGEVPIDLWPDANVYLELDLKPKLVDGKLTFSIDTDLDVDTGFWGDVLAFTIGALVGLLIAFLTGGLVLIPSIGLGAVIVLEIVEYAAGEIIERIIVAKDEHGNVMKSFVCDDQLVKLASPKPNEGGFSINVLDAIPSSIPIFVDQNDPLFNRMLTVEAIFDELKLNGKGLAVAGKSEAGELFEPTIARLVEAIYDQDELKQLKYFVPASNTESTLDLEEVILRLNGNELQSPLKGFADFPDPQIQMPAGKLCCPCLHPTHIRREETIITRIKFDTGLELNTPDAIMLQDRAGIYLEGLQLIHPIDGNPYYRAPANSTTDDNFESLPEF